MNIPTKKSERAKSRKIKHYFSDRKKVREWAWFITLWLAGLGAVTAITYPIKFLIR